MKKVLIISITLALVFLMAGAAAAEEVTLKDVTISQLGGHGETVVSYGVSEGYTLQIPSDFSFGPGKFEMTSEVKASSVSLYSNKMLNVTVTSEHQWELLEHVEVDGQMSVKNDGDSLSYSLSFTLDGEDKSYSYGDPSVTVPVLQVLEGISEKSTPLRFTLIDTTSSSAGHFQDRLHFNANIVEAPSSSQPNAVQE